MAQSPPYKPAKTHPGIRIEKIPVKGAAGLIFTLGVMFIFWAGIPTVRGFVVLGVLGGLAATAALLWWRSREGDRSDRALFPEATNSVTVVRQSGGAARSTKRD